MVTHAGQDIKQNEGLTPSSNVNDKISNCLRERDLKRVQVARIVSVELSLLSLSLSLLQPARLIVRIVHYSYQEQSYHTYKDSPFRNPETQ
jgi:hypothetical protein